MSDSEIAEKFEKLNSDYVEKSTTEMYPLECKIELPEITTISTNFRAKPTQTTFDLSTLSQKARPSWLTRKGTRPSRPQRPYINRPFKKPTRPTPETVAQSPLSDPVAEPVPGHPLNIHIYFNVSPEDIKPDQTFVQKESDHVVITNDHNHNIVQKDPPYHPQIEIKPSYEVVEKEPEPSPMQIDQNLYFRPTEKPNSYNTPSNNRLSTAFIKPQYGFVQKIPNFLSSINEKEPAQDILNKLSDKPFSFTTEFVIPSGFELVKLK